MAAPPWAPAVSDISALIPQRTGDATGRASGSFSANTVPTDVQVQGLIASTAPELIGYVGATPDAFIQTLAATALSLAVASMVELSFYPDSNMTAQGPAAQLWDRYETLLDEIASAQSGEGDMVGPAAPVFYFPAAVETGAGSSLWETM